MAAQLPTPSVARLRPTAVGGGLLVGLSLLLSIGARHVLAGQVRIRWTVGPSQYYGPEYAPAGVVLAAFPLLAAGTYVTLRWLGRRLERAGMGDDLAWAYELAVLGVMAMLLLVQATLIGANLSLE